MRAGKLIAALVGLALLTVPAAAQATLAYNTNSQKPRLWVAQDNGKGAKQVGLGTDPKVSPNGELVAYERFGKSGAEMKLYDVATGKTKTLLTRWVETSTLAWSPDSTSLAAERGGELGKRTLYVVDVATGKQTKIATGYFEGVSYSPSGEEIAFGIGEKQVFPAKTDVVRAPIAGGPTRALTHDGLSGAPLWGPQGQIVFVKRLGAKQRKYGPKNDLFLVNADGKGVKRLTHTKVAPLTAGLFPVAWSGSGKQLLTQFEGQDTSYAVTVNPATGKERSLSPGNTETGFTGVALTPDGKTVLGYLGGFLGSASQQKIASVPYGGGKPKVLVKRAFSPSWGG